MKNILFVVVFLGFVGCSEKMRDVRFDQSIFFPPKEEAPHEELEPVADHPVVEKKNPSKWWWE